MAQKQGRGRPHPDGQVVPVTEAAIVSYHDSLVYAGPPPVPPGSIFAGRNEHLQPDHRVPVMWRSREEGWLQADNDDNDGVELLWALKDHVRTKAKTTMFNAVVVRDAASQHRKRGSVGCSSTAIDAADVAHNDSRAHALALADAHSLAAPDGHSTQQLEAFAI